MSSHSQSSGSGAGSSNPSRPGQTGAGSSNPSRPGQTGAGSSNPSRPGQTGAGSSNPSRPGQRLPSANIVGVFPDYRGSFWEIIVRGLAYREDCGYQHVWYTFDLTHPFHNLTRIWEKNNKKGIFHSHDHDYMNRNCGMMKDFFPFECIETVLYAKVFCVGGDHRIQGIADINKETLGPRITHRNACDNVRSTQRFPSCDITVSEGSCDFVYSRNEQNLNTSQYIYSVNFHSSSCQICAEFISPRLNPKVVSIGKRIYFFSGNKPPENEDEYVPFVEYFDPATGLCYLAKDPPFPRRLGSRALIVVPLLGRHGEHKILVMSRIVSLSIQECPPDGFDAIYVYDILMDSWEKFDDPGDDLFNHIIHIVGNVVSVAENESIYWLSRDGMMHSYNWREKLLSHGILDGLEHEESFKNFCENAKPLIHIEGNFFCIVWDEPLDHNGEYMSQYHVTVLRVSKDNQDLNVKIVECFGFLGDEMNMKTALLRRRIYRDR